MSDSFLCRFVISALILFLGSGLLHSGSLAAQLLGEILPDWVVVGLIFVLLSFLGAFLS